MIAGFYVHINLENGGKEDYIYLFKKLKTPVRILMHV